MQKDVSLQHCLPYYQKTLYKKIISLKYQEGSNMSDSQIKEVSLEQQCKNLEFQNENISRVLQKTNEELSILQKKLNTTNEFSVRMKINSLNTQLVEITSQIIQKSEQDSQLATKQAFITGQIQILNEFSNHITITSEKLNSLIISTSNRN